MKLNDFESYIDKKILARGIDYFENNCVSSIEEVDENTYKAEVEGTDLYEVEVWLDDKENIIDTKCDCPYDMGEYCKHQVAVFFALRKMKNKTSVGENQDGENCSKDSEANHKSPVVKKRNTIDIKKILTDRTKDELVDFLFNIASDYEEIRRRIELNFDIGTDEDEINKSITLIRTYIKKNSDKWGYVSYGDTDEAVAGANMVLEKARSVACENNKTLNKTIHAVDLVLCVTHEMIDLLQEADDSDGVIGGMIEESFALIDEIIEDEELSQAYKEAIFDKLIEEVVNKRYDEWNDWKIELLEKCTELGDNPRLRNILENQLISMINSEKVDSRGYNRFAEKINLIRYYMIEKYDGPKRAKEFIEQNLQYPDFREMAIESAMKKKDYDRVIKLTEDGEVKDKSWLGLVKRWKEYRYRAFQLSGKLEEQRGIAMDFILDGSFEYYKELKNTYDKKEWTSVYPKIIFLFENQKKTYEDAYTRILIEEEEKQKLLEYIEGKPSSVESFYKNLMPEYKDAVYALFLKYIEQTASGANSRKDYQGVCAIIRNLEKAGGKEQALQIKQILFTKYANRPAFRDELSKV